MVRSCHRCGPSKYRCNSPLFASRRILFPSSRLPLLLTSNLPPLGQIILIVAKNADGWFEGSLEDTGAHGLFPGNYVEELPADEQDTSAA